MTTKKRWKKSRTGIIGIPILVMFSCLLPVKFNRAYGSDDNPADALETARVLALRNLSEMLYGVKLQFIETAEGSDAGAFFSVAGAKSERRTLRGVEYVEKYDPSTGIAQVTAELALKNMAGAIDPNRFDLKENPEMVIRRTAFAAATRSGAVKIGAFRAAEIEAYRQLYKLIRGFELDSSSQVHNSALTSDKTRTAAMGALLGAKVYGIGWQGEGNDAVAIVKLRIGKKELEKAFGHDFPDIRENYIESIGRARAGFSKSSGSDTGGLHSMMELKPVMENKMDDLTP